MRPNCSRPTSSFLAAAWWSRYLGPAMLHEPDIAAAARGCHKPLREMADDPAPSGPYRIATRKNNKSSGRTPDELFTTRAAQGIRGLGRVGRPLRTAGRARADGRIHLQICQ